MAPYYVIKNYLKNLLQVTARVTNCGALRNYVVAKIFIHFFVFEKRYGC